MTLWLAVFGNICFVKTGEEPTTALTVSWTTSVADNLKGLYTIGVKLINGVQTSVKVSLEYIQTAYENAVSAAQKALEAATKANNAAGSANSAASSANSAATKANTAAGNADKATAAAKTATN